MQRLPTKEWGTKHDKQKKRKESQPIRQREQNKTSFFYKENKTNIKSFGLFVFKKMKKKIRFCLQGNYNKIILGRKKGIENLFVLLIFKNK